MCRWCGPETIRNLSTAVSMWRSVPIITVITKSYSKPDRELNVQMVRQAFAGQRVEKNLRAIIPVVAQTYVIDITVITKSYSKPDRELNVQMVRQAFAGQRVEKNLRAIIPVVAQTYVIDETSFVGPEGITDLIDETMKAMPTRR